MRANKRKEGANECEWVRESRDPAPAQMPSKKIRPYVRDPEN